MTKDREVDFDVDIAIRVCRQAGYFKHALALAEKHAKHDLYLKVQIDDNLDYKEALRYMNTLTPEECEHQMKLYGSILIDKEPEETTSLLKKLSQQPDSHPELFIPFFIKSGSQMLAYLEHVVSIPGKMVSPLVWNTLIEYNLDVYKSMANNDGKKDVEIKIMNILTNDKSNYATEQALVLCQLNNFAPGFLYMYQKCGLYEEILKYHFQSGNYEEGILTCRR